MIIKNIANFILIFSISILNFSFVEASDYSKKSDFITTDRIFKNIKTKPYNWQKYDSGIDKKIIFENIIKQLPKSPWYQSKPFNSLLQYFHALKLSEDGNGDIIVYDGCCSPYSRIEIWVNRNGKFNTIYSQAGYIAELNNYEKLYEIVIKKNGCCCNNESVIEYVTLDKTTNSVFIKERVAYTMDIIIPDFTFSKKIKIVSDKGILRNNPEKDDSLTKWECNDDFFIKGNILAEYPINTEGVALAKVEDKNNVWFFVVIYSNSNSYQKKIKYPINEHSVSFGWINSNLLRSK